MSQQHRILSKDELEEVIETALSKHEPRLRDMMIKLLDERQEIIGYPNKTEEQRAENKADAMFIRDLRNRYDKAAKSVGDVVMKMILIGLAVVAGIGGRKLGLF